MLNQQVEHYDFSRTNPSLISNIESEFDYEYVPEDKYHDDRYLTELLASETKFAIHESNYDLDRAGLLLSEFILEDIAHCCKKEQILKILDTLKFKEFVEHYLDSENWEE